MVKFYRHAERVKRPKPPQYDISKITLTNTPMGLGDCVILTDHLRDGGYAWSPSPSFKPLVDGNPAYIDQQTPEWVSIAAANSAYNLGPGHMCQRIQRMFGREVTPLPSGFVHVPGALKHPNRVIVHFEAGIHSDYQRKKYHPRARQVYPESLAIIRKFFQLHPEYEVLEVGAKPVLGAPAIDLTGKPLNETIKLMANASWCLSILSGPSHLATALGLQVINIINFPEPHQLMLPNLVNTGVVESEWIAPQTMVLHQDSDSLHWPRFGLSTLSAAFQHEVYPYNRAMEFGQLITK